MLEKLQKLNKRFICHRTGFNQPGKYGFCRILSDHFHKGVYCNASYSVQMLEKFDGNGRKARNNFNASITPGSRQHGEIWMPKVRTVYPYRLDGC